MQHPGFQGWRRDGLTREHAPTARYIADHAATRYADFRLRPARTRVPAAGGRRPHRTRARRIRSASDRGRRRADRTEKHRRAPADEQCVRGAERGSPAGGHRRGHAGRGADRVRRHADPEQQPDPCVGRLHEGGQALAPAPHLAGCGGRDGHRQAARPRHPGTHGDPSGVPSSSPRRHREPPHHRGPPHAGPHDLNADK